jgi:hypothetical protein
MMIHHLTSLKLIIFLSPLLKAFREKADAQKYSDDPIPELEQLRSVYMTN